MLEPGGERGLGRLALRLDDGFALQQIAAALEQVAQGDQAGIRCEAGPQVDMLTEAPQQPCIDAVSLGQQPFGISKGPDPNRMDHADLQPGGQQRGDNWPLVAAGRFADDPAPGQGPQELDQGVVPSGGVGDVTEVGFVQCVIELSLRNIEANVGAFRYGRHGFTPSCNASSAGSFSGSS